jgi:16S rRNA G527 N7-methylase RsmG
LENLMKKHLVFILAVALPLSLISLAAGQSNQEKFNQARDAANARAEAKARAAFGTSHSHPKPHKRTPQQEFIRIRNERNRIAEARAKAAFDLGRRRKEAQEKARKAAHGHDRKGN